VFVFKLPGPVSKPPRSPREASASEAQTSPFFLPPAETETWYLALATQEPPRKQFANKAKSKVFREAVRGHILTWYLAYILTFYLAFYLTYILTFYPEASSLDYASRVRLNHALDCALNHPLDLLALLI
jgi:hypothetical protein